jgi:hypothetical protein
MNFFNNLFGNHQQPAPPPQMVIVCPYCMKELHSDHELEQCTNPKCQAELPILYRRAGYAKPPTHPLFLQVAGIPASGKTLYLYALTLMLRKMPMLWPGFFPNAANDETRVIIREIAQFEQTGVLPNPTGLTGNQAYIMMLQRMGVYSDRGLVIRDVSGEAFQGFEFNVEYAPYLIHVPTTLMFFDLNDMQAKGYTMDDMLNSYIVTLLANDKNPHQDPRNIVAVISKADQLRDLTPGLEQYLNNDTLWQDVTSGGSPAGGSFDAQRLGEYITRMGNVSNAIGQWLMRRDASAAAFLSMAQANNIGVRFSLVSSLGGGLTDGRMTAFSPRRVIDPFLWTMEFERYYAR